MKRDVLEPFGAARLWDSKEGLGFRVHLLFRVLGLRALSPASPARSRACVVNRSSLKALNQEPLPSKDS